MPYSVGRNGNCLAKVRKLSILPTSFDINDARQHYVRILCLLYRSRSTCKLSDLNTSAFKISHTHTHTHHYLHRVEYRRHQIIRFVSLIHVGRENVVGKGEKMFVINIFSFFHNVLKKYNL